MEIVQLELYSSRVTQLRDFYANLGFSLDEDSNEKLSITIGRSKLVFKKASTGNPFYHFAFNIPFESIISARSWLIEKKISLIWMSDYENDIADFVNWHAKSVYFYDPVGNIVELIGRRDLHEQAEIPFTSKQVSCISEVGLVFPGDELEERTKKLIEQFGLRYFDKQPPLPQFKAVGDDDGLFIIVPANRNWYPTDKPSGIFPMEICFNGHKMKIG